MRYEIYSDNNFSPFKIKTIGFSSDRKITRFGPGQRNLYIIHYVTKGRGYYNGSSVTKGQGFLIAPGQFEEYYADENDPWEFLWIISTDDAMKEIFGRYNTNPNTLIFNYDSVPVVEKIANEIISENVEIFNSLKMLEMFLQIFNSHSYKSAAPQYKNNSEIYLDFCINYIDSNIHNKITVEELARLLGVSQPYLYKIFKNKFGMSTKDYIMMSKIKYAKRLLIETDMSITGIANSTGYSDVLAFSKSFSAKENISPQKYRMTAKKL